MNMAVRNFWVEADIDGYNSTPAGGPRRKDGGMDITVYQREDGGIKTAVQIFCRSLGEKLITKVEINGKLVGKFETAR